MPYGYPDKILPAYDLKKENYKKTYEYRKEMRELQDKSIPKDYYKNYYSDWCKGKLPNLEGGREVGR